MKKTTDLDKLKNGASFTWGEIIEIQEIGPYAIATFHPRKVDGVTITSKINRDEIGYHGWVAGKSTGQTWFSLDAAIAGCIACRHEGPNHSAGHYFMKMLGA